MDLAFSAILLFLLFLPGIILRFAFLRGSHLNSPFVITSFTDEVGKSAIWTIVLHLIWCCVASKLGFTVDINAVLTLLAVSDPAHPSDLTVVIREASDSALMVAIYFLSLYFLSYFLGWAAHGIVHGLHFDLRFAKIRPRNQWYYLVKGLYTQFSENKDYPWFSNEKPGVVILSTVVVQGEVTFIYRGYVYDYFFDKDGNLDQIVLCYARRRRLIEDRTDEVQHTAGGDERFYPIVGDLFLIKYSEMQTINIEAYDAGISVQSDDGAISKPAVTAILLLCSLVLMSWINRRPLKTEPPSSSNTA